MYIEKEGGKKEEVSITKTCKCDVAFEQSEIQR